MSEISVNGPVSVVLTPQELQVVIAGLQELPFKFSQPVLASIERQLAEALAPKEENG